MAGLMVDGRMEQRPWLLQRWWLAARPKTLPAAAAPVLVGTASVAGEAAFSWRAAVTTLACAWALQVAANFANDSSDCARGADSAMRLGPRRACAEGWISLAAMRRATATVLGFAVLLGGLLVARAGMPILLVGLLSGLAALAYSVGPKPLSYLGLGEVFAFVFFGPVAVVGTAFIQTQQVEADACWASVPMGLLAVCLLMVNNLRDQQEDARAGKETMVVRLGRRASLGVLAGAWLMVVVWPLLLWGAGRVPWTWSLGVALSPWAVALWRDGGRFHDARLNAVLASTARFMMVYALLLAGGMLLA